MLMGACNPTVCPLHVVRHMSDYPGLSENFTFGSSGPDSSEHLALYRWACAAVLDAANVTGVGNVAALLVTHCAEVVARLVLPLVDQTDDNGGRGALMVYDAVPLTIAHRSPGWTYGFYPLGVLDPDKHLATLEATLDLWGRKNNDLIPKAVDPLTQFDQRDDLYYAGMVPLNALAGRGDAAYGNITEFLGTATVATGCLPIGTHCPPCDRAIGLDRRWNHCITPTAMYLETNNPVFEGPMMVANGLQEMLLFGSMGGTTMRPGRTLIKVFPAVPTGWTDAVFHHLLAEGAFLVSARRKAGLLEFFSITARGSRTDLEIRVGDMRGPKLCVQTAAIDAATSRVPPRRRQAALAWARGHLGVIVGTVPLGTTVTVHAVDNGTSCTDHAQFNSTEFLPGDPSEFNHYGYRARLIPTGQQDFQ